MKYLITHDQRDAILSIPGYSNLKESIRELKPIEPLSDEQIDDAVIGMGLMPTRYDRELSRAIENHILGERHENS